MSWIVDIVIVGAIGIAAWYFISNMGKMQSPLLGGGLAPSPIAAEPTTGATGLAEKKYGLAPAELCVGRGSDFEGVKCKCTEEGPVTFGLCDMPEGIKCSVNITSNKATVEAIKEMGLEGCKMNGERGEIELALGGTPAPKPETPAEDGEDEDEDEDKESSYARSFYSAQSPSPPFTMCRSDGLHIVEPRGGMSTNMAFAMSARISSPLFS